MNVFAIPVRRPVATAMFFLGIFLLGAIAWIKIPVELVPPFSGETLFVSFFRMGSAPEVVEREILMPLEAGVKELPGVEETSGEINGASGNFRVRFKHGTDVKLRELDLSRIVAELTRTQPPGTSIRVDIDPARFAIGFAMYVQVTGMDDLNSLLDLVEQRITMRLAAVPGVSQVIPLGGAPREMTVRIDPDRCAAMGVLPDQVEAALRRSVQRLRFIGGVEDSAGRTAVILDGRPRGEVSLAETRISPDGAVLLRHVADVGLGAARQETLYLVNGSPAVALVVYQDEDANLVELGRDLRSRLDALRDEFRPYGIDFIINFDAAEMVEEQIDRLKRLALSGFVIALVVLFLFLRQWRAVGVVAVAVPASLLSALALLYLAGQSLNIVTLFGLAVGIGMLVDNSIVVYEAVQRQLERGVAPDAAAENGVRRTVRAILAASLTNAVVFLPVAFVEFDDPTIRAILKVLVIAILTPLAGSILVAVGLVPMLARKLAAPAALARIVRLRRQREVQGGLRAPDRLRGLFGALLTVALRRPGVWMTLVAVAVLVTVIAAFGWGVFSAVSQEPPEASQVQFALDINSGGSLESARASFARLEQAVLEIDGVERVESQIREEGGALTVHMLDPDDRPPNVNANTVRSVVRETVKKHLSGVQLRARGSGSSGDGQAAGLATLQGSTPSRVIISGPDARELTLLASEIKEKAESIPEIDTATVLSQTGRDEIRVTPDRLSLSSFGLTADQVLPALNVISREGVRMRTGFTLYDGREIPMTVRRETSGTRAGAELRRLRLATPAGVLPLSAIADVRKMPPPPTIIHKDGRRQIEVSYRLNRHAPASGPARAGLEEEIRQAIQAVHRPAGYTVETPRNDDGTDWFKSILVPVILLLFAVLALTFESVTMPLLVLVSLPLTLLGAIWALILAGMTAQPMVLMGLLALIGLTVNPAILLVDRMQQRAHNGATAGAAALAAVRERARPVLMTATTTIAGLWPLALVTGRENEIWPPFATVVMGGLITSTMLTLLVIPVGFTFLHRLDAIFGRLGPWILIGWFGSTTAVMAPLITRDVIDSVFWQIVTTLVVAAALLGLAVLIFRRSELPQPEATDGPPPIDIRYLRKTYDLPGPIGRAWRVQERFAERVLRAGGKLSDPSSARARILPLLMVLPGTLYLAFSMRTAFWTIGYLFVSAMLLAALARQVRRARGQTDDHGRVTPGGIEGVIAALAPWAALAWVVFPMHLIPRLESVREDVRLWVPIALGLLLLLVQAGRHTALRLARGKIEDRLIEGRMRRSRSLWRRFSRAVFGLDLPRKPVQAVTGVAFKVERGMVGILGPNGAGKTTLLRMLAGILDPTLGTITIGGVRLEKLRRYLARFMGYLPQDFGLPEHLTAREYLDYYALLYELRPAAARKERVEALLKEVGLAERAGERIGSFSCGMRQRVAVARTLLRLPPVIIVDEPTVGLDPRERIRFRNLLARLAEGRIVLFSTHVVEDVEVACERVIVMARGSVVFDGPPPDLAHEAEGKIWTANLDDPDKLPEGVMLVDQVPLASGASRCRMLSLERPHADAEPAAPSLEDGYLWLVGVAGR